MKSHSSLLLPALLLLSACAPSVSSLIDEGRVRLDEGDPAGALECFEEATARDAESTDGQVWLVRSWLALERIDDSLEATDELKDAGAPQPDLDYLYGLCFHARALRAVTTGSGGAYTQSEFEDATRFLASATEANAERYADAFLPLAESGWYAQDLPTATAAVMSALTLEPGSPDAHMLHGRIAFSSYSQARTDEASEEAITTHWDEAVTAFEQAVETSLAEDTDSGRIRAFDANLQIGLLYVWNEDLESASVAYGDAMVLNPWSINFNEVIGYVGLENFLDQILLARAECVSDEAADAAALPLYDWWTGFAQFGLGRMPAAEQSFSAVIDSTPEFTSAWYYLFRSAYGQRKYELALMGLRTNWHQAPEELVALIAYDKTLNLAILEYLVGWLVNEEQQDDGSRPREAAILAEIMTRADPEQPRYWNNLGLFLRDYGEALEHEQPAPRAEDIDPLWEGAYAAYSRTLELEPDNAGYLNDTAVMLHYHLERDYDEALAMYDHAFELAEAELERDDITEGQREWMTTARRDARNNARLLRKRMEVSAAEPD